MLRRGNALLDKVLLVESPNKVRSVSAYAAKCITGEAVVVLPTIGHCKHQTEVSLAPTFAPVFDIHPTKKDTVAKIVAAVKDGKVNEVILATDPDREGELISFHILTEVLRARKVPYSRAYIHAITESGVADALKQRKKDFYDEKLVEAAMARHAMDRMFGFAGSRYVSNVVPGAKSLGRVQTPALSLVVQREAELQDAKKKKSSFGLSAVVELQGKPLRASFTGPESATKAHRSAAAADEALAALALSGKAFAVTKVDTKKANVSPPEAFTLQALMTACGKKYKMTNAEVAESTQKLFTQGLITYPRTDSTRIDDVAVGMIKAFVSTQYKIDASAVTAKKAKKKKTGNVEDAHEAIRPTSMNPNAATGVPYSTNDANVYRMIFYTTVAAYMPPKETESLKITVEGEGVSLEARASRVVLPGFTSALAELQSGGSDASSDVVLDDDEKVLSSDDFVSLSNSKGERVTITDSKVVERKATAPPRFIEGTLIEALKKKGVGRPSTYPSIMTTLHQRQYVTADKDGKLSPTKLGTSVSETAMSQLPQFAGTDFTARMEAGMDAITGGKTQRAELMLEFFSSLQEALTSAVKANADGKRQMLSLNEYTAQSKTLSDFLFKFSRYLLESGVRQKL